MTGVMEPADARRARSAKDARLLLVEDDDDIRTTLAGLLSDEGYDVSASLNGRDALSVLRGHDVDLVILDLHMPVMNGWEFLIAKRQEPALARIPVIAMSADSSPHAAAVHADQYLRKPFKPAQLILTIERLFLERERELLATRLRETERVALLGTIAAGVGHEINNPLTYVVGNLALLDSRLLALCENPATIPLQIESLRALVKDAQVGVDRIRGVVSTLKTLSHARDERLRALDVRRVLEQAIEMSWNEIRHRATLVKELDDVPPVEGNEGRLGQVFVNLLVNAAQAIEPGHVDGNEIRVQLRRDDGDVVVRISDTGRGIPDELRPRIFEPFFTTKAPGTGTGLGLAISREIVVAHHGRIEVDAGTPRGSVFTIVLPASAAAHEAAPPEITPAPLRKGPAPRGHVLVIDDDPLVLRTLTRVLERDHKVTPRTRAREALEDLERGTVFDAIVCDLMMPEMTGMELHALVFERWPDVAARIVFLTGGAFTPDARAFRDTAANRFVDKPLDLAVLLASVAEAVAAFRASRGLPRAPAPS